MRQTSGIQKRVFVNAAASIRDEPDRTHRKAISSGSGIPTIYQRRAALPSARRREILTNFSQVLRWTAKGRCGVSVCRATLRRVVRIRTTCALTHVPACEFAADSGAYVQASQLGCRSGLAWQVRLPTKPNRRVKLVYDKLLVKKAGEARLGLSPLQGG